MFSLVQVSKSLGTLDLHSVPSAQTHSEVLSQKVSGKSESYRIKRRLKQGVSEGGSKQWGRTHGSSRMTSSPSVWFKHRDTTGLIHCRFWKLTVLRSRGWPRVTAPMTDKWFISVSVSADAGSRVGHIIHACKCPWLNMRIRPVLWTVLESFG